MANPFQSFASGTEKANHSEEKAISNKTPSGEAQKNIYDSLGVRSVINGRGTVTIIGASRILPEVKRAMDEATRSYVQLDELMEGVGSRLAELTGAKWGIVTSGATGALTVATAGIVTGGDPDKLWQLPDLKGMKNEVIIPSYSWTAYETAARVVGVKMIEVTSPEEMENAMNDNTALVLVLAGEDSEHGPLSTSVIASMAKPRGIPVLVDAAAEGLPVPNPHLSQGADLVAYSGGKYLRGPQCSGLLLGRKDLVQAAWIVSAPHHGFGRGYKVGREEIMGMLAAVEMWMKKDHNAEMKKWTSWLTNIEKVLKKIPGVRTELQQPRGRSNPSPDLKVQWDPAIIPLTGYDVENLLWDNTPRVAVSGAGSFLPFPPNMQPNILINSSQMETGEEHLVAKRVYDVLSNPPVINKNNAPAAFNVSGNWNLSVKFVASTVDQKFSLEQKGNDLSGMHSAAYGQRLLSGSLNGNEILMRSSYTKQGVRLNFEFTGIVKDKEMEGTLSMGEYGKAYWKAKRQLS